MQWQVLTRFLQSPNKMVREVLEQAFRTITANLASMDQSEDFDPQKAIKEELERIFGKSLGKRIATVEGYQKSGWNFYYSDNYTRLETKLSEQTGISVFWSVNPGHKPPIEDVAKEIAVQYHALPDEEKQKYSTEAVKRRAQEQQKVELDTRSTTWFKNQRYYWGHLKDAVDTLFPS